MYKNSGAASFTFTLDQTISLFIASSTYSNAVKCIMYDQTVLSVPLDALYEDIDHLAFLFSPKCRRDDSIPPSI